MHIPHDSDGKPGLRVETAAVVTARDMITKHLQVFGHVIQGDRTLAPQIVAEYTNGLAGAVALAIEGGLGSRQEIIEMSVLKLREYIARDLRELEIRRRIIR